MPVVVLRATSAVLGMGAACLLQMSVVNFHTRAPVPVIVTILAVRDLGNDVSSQMAQKRVNRALSLSHVLQLLSLSS